MYENIKDQLKESYERNARSRDRDYIVPWKIKELEKFLSYTKFQCVHSLLDLGAGTGQYAKHLQNKGLQVTCIDISTEMIKACKEKALEAYVMDFYDLNFEEESFDAVWSLNTLLHIPKKHIDQVLKNVKRVLKPKGLFYIGVYGGHNSEGIYEDDFYTPKRFFSFYDNEKIKEVVSKHFEIVDFEFFTPENSNRDFQSIILRKE